MVLRGGRDGPNHDAVSVQRALERMRAVDVLPRVLIDASHENSGKDYRRQPAVAREIAAQVAGGEAGIVGVMLEASWSKAARIFRRRPRWSMARASPTAV